MKLSALFTLLVLFGSVSAEPFIPVEDAESPCIEYGCIYYEWRIPSLPNVRYVASGYDDGIDYAFYLVNDDGSFELLFHVNPIVVDENGHFWWGYPWITTGIVLEKNGDQIEIRASFDHMIVREGVHSVPDWQKRLPAVLFEGKTGKVPQPDHKYTSFSLAELKRDAGGS